MRPSAGTRFQRTRGHDGVASAPPSPAASNSTSSSGVGRRLRRRGPRRVAQSSSEDSVGGTDAGEGCSAGSCESDDADVDDVTSPAATPGKQRGSPSGATGGGAAQAAGAAQADAAGDAQAEREALQAEKRRKFALSARKVLLNEKKNAKQKLSPPTGAMAFFGHANGGLRFDAKGVSTRFKMLSKLVHPDKCARLRALEPRARARPRELRRAPLCAVSMMDGAHRGGGAD